MLPEILYQKCSRQKTRCPNRIGIPIKGIYFLNVELNFDRGTLVLKGGEGCALPPDFQWDFRVGLFRAPAYRHEIIRQCGKFAFLDNVNRILPPPATRQRVTLRPYQEAALGSWQVSGRRGLVVLPTGAGKTMVALGAIMATGGSALCLVPTLVLLEQWKEELEKFFIGSVGLFGDGTRTLAPITVSTFESAYRHMAEIGNRFKCLIVDEVHHFGRGVRDEALEMCTAPFRLGLTATPLDDQESLRKIDDLIGPTVFKLTTTELKGEYLAPFQLLPIQVDLSPHERTRYETAIQRFRECYSSFIQGSPEAAWVQFVRFAGTTLEGRMALAAWHTARKVLNFPTAKAEVLGSLLDRHPDKKILIFTADTGTAYEISRRFLIMPVTAEIKRTEREEVLGRFRTGSLRSLVSCRVLNEGMDVPDADVAIIVGGVLGEREHIQRIGRCLRPREGKKALVYELVVRDSIEVRHWRRRSKSLGSGTFSQV